MTNSEPSLFDRFLKQHPVATVFFTTAFDRIVMPAAKVIVLFTNSREYQHARSANGRRLWQARAARVLPQT